MWRRLSIRSQLIVLLAILLFVVDAGTLGVAYWFDVKERKALAVEQADTLGRALSHDLLKALLNPSTDVYSNVSFRLSGFHALDALVLLDANAKPVYHYSRRDNLPSPAQIEASTKEPRFSNQFLFLRKPLISDGYAYGSIAYLIDLSSYHTRLNEHLLTLLLIFPLELVFGLFLAAGISRAYTRPFSELAQAMQQSDVQNNCFPRIKTALKNEVGVLYEGYNRTVSKIEAATSDLKYLSEHDSMTGLLNRYAIEQELSRILQQAVDTTYVLLLFDLDQFKLVNDAVGHVAGDELLKQLSHLCKESLPDDVMIARVGGDDFYVLCPHTNEGEGLDVAGRLLERLRNFRFIWEQGAFSVSLSIGLVAFRPFDYTLEALETAVDTAFYAAKAKGRNHLHVYRADDGQIQQYSEDLQASAIIKEALQGGASRFELFGQVIMPLQKQDDRMSYEILVRLRDAKGELLMPNRFLPTAMRYQLITEMDIHVFWTYLETVLTYPQHLDNLAFVNINLAGTTLNRTDFQNKVKEAVNTFAFPWEKLVFEVTETSAVGNLAQASDFIKYCRSIGIRVALDDFGTGMASFEYLKSLPLDVVKIDGCFIRDMLSDPLDHAMVRYAHDICKLRGQETIAEFVEDAEQLQELKRLGIDYAQGYFLGKPTPLSDWLNQTRNNKLVKKA